MARPLNIVYINSHDTGRYIQPHGHPVLTPNLQRLAKAGTLFRRNHCAAPTCSPSRAALLTGQSAHNSGMLGLAHRGFRLNDPKQHLAHFLRDHGYRTAAWGMPDNHVGQGDHQELGYERWLGPATSTASVADFLKQHANEPFFLSASTFMTHRRGDGFTTDADPTRYDPRYTLPAPCLPDRPEVRADWAHFCSDVTAWDVEVGKLLAILEASGRADDTLVIATTDHGVPFPMMKCNLTHNGTGVFMILQGPGGFSGGKVVDQLTSHIDVYPTICELAELPQPSWLQGVSLRRALEGETVHDELFGEVTYHAAYEPMRSVRNDRYLYIRRFGEHKQRVLANVDGGLTRDLLLRTEWRDTEPPAEALFDTLLDPEESTNRITEPRYTAQAQHLRQRLERWMQDTHDPLLQGDVPAPEGARVDPPSARNSSG